MTRSAKSPPCISSVEQLRKALGNRFVILFGSAVSGKHKPKVPMAYEVKEQILTLAADRLRLGSKSDQLVSNYALALIEGRYKKILESTKFETFLWRIGRATDKAKLEDLLIELYVCSGDEYGPNQSAIAFLLDNRICLACLTTNFDNALELSYQSLTVFDQTYEPDSLPTKHDEPILLKLHGDAASRSCVATSLELSEAKLRNQYDYLEDLLRGQRILLLGYSGTGDVDISPHLNNLDAQLFWGMRPSFSTQESHPNRIPVCCDLSANGSEGNLLLGLAQVFGWPGTWSGKIHPWKEALQRWIEGIDATDLNSMVRSLLGWQTSWPNAHMAYFRSRERDFGSAKLTLAKALVPLAAYTSSENTLREVLSIAALDLRLQVEAQMLLGFTLWRKGKFQEALKTISPIIEPDFWNEISDPEIRYFIADAMRNYLEAISEMMQYRTHIADRLRLYKATRADNVVSSLDVLRQRGMGNTYLTRLVILELNHAIGERVEATEVNELFQECYDMEEWAAASAASRLLLSLSFRDGFAAVRKLDEQLLQRGNLKLIQKNWASVVHGLFHGRFPLILRVLNGRLLMGVKTAAIELFYRMRRWVWNKDWDAERLRVE